MRENGSVKYAAEISVSGGERESLIDDANEYNIICNVCAALGDPVE